MALNLRNIANGLTQSINPNITGQLRRSNGYSRDRAYKSEPTYAAVAPVALQVQALSKKEIEHLDSMNLSNATRAVYANQQMTGVDRVSQSGGDLLDFTDPETGKASTWLVIAVLEAWGGVWCKVAVAKQIDGAPNETLS